MQIGITTPVELVRTAVDSDDSKWMASVPLPWRALPLKAPPLKALPLKVLPLTALPFVCP